MVIRAIALVWLKCKRLTFLILCTRLFVYIISVCVCVCVCVCVLFELVIVLFPKKNSFGALHKFELAEKHQQGSSQACL